MKVSFIVLTHHRGEFLQKCLDSIYMQEGLPHPYEVLVVDNGSDAQAAPAADPEIQLRVEVPGENLWVTGGRNYGMARAHGEYFVFIDDDAVWTSPDDARRLIAHLDEDPKCGAVGVKSRAPNGDVIVEELTLPDKAHALSLGQPTEVPYYYGVGTAMRASLVAQIGGYPERFHVFAEEIDLSLRMIDAGYHILFDPNVSVYHYKTDLGRPFKGASYWQYNALNKTRVAWRLLPFPYPLTTLFVWSAAVLIKTRQPRIVWRVWRELWSERRLLKAERRPIRSQTVAYLKQIGARLWY